MWFDGFTLPIKREDWGRWRLRENYSQHSRLSQNSSMICVKTGTTIKWQTADMNTGFEVDFGVASPFGSPKIISGNTDRPVTVVTKQVGRFKYSVTVCTRGPVYGTCGNSDFAKWKEFTRRRKWPEPLFWAKRKGANDRTPKYQKGRVDFVL
jgi:hypothetical protein